MNLPGTKETVIGSVGVLAVGGAIVSFTHVYGFARAAHQAPGVALVYPLLTDVLVLSATVCLLHAAQHNLPATPPRWAFALGVVATVTANIGDYFRSLPVLVGAIVSGWSAVAFIFGVLLAHWYWGSVKPATHPVPAPGPAEVQEAQLVPPPVPAEVQEVQAITAPVPAAPNGHDPNVTAVLQVYPLGAKPTIRQIREVLECGQAKAREVQGRIQDLTEVERVL